MVGLPPGIDGLPPGAFGLLPGTVGHFFLLTYCGKSGDRCDFEAAWKKGLYGHIHSVHEGVAGTVGLSPGMVGLPPGTVGQFFLLIYCSKSGDRCDFEAAWKEALYGHIHFVHVGVRPCPEKL